MALHTGHLHKAFHEVAIEAILCYPIPTEEQLEAREPVSYTHLDVYKRQGCPLQPLEYRIMAGIVGFKPTVAGIKGRCLSRLAISQYYGDPRRTRTGHCSRERDVYKRQFLVALMVCVIVLD